jgi:hypothetical protein
MAFTHVQLVYLRANTAEEQPKPDVVPPLPAHDEAVRQGQHFRKVTRFLYAAKRGIDYQPTTLKILMAPEFYFRHPHGKYAGTDHFGNSERTQILAELMGLGAKDGALRRQPWLVVPGTIVWTYLADAASGRLGIMNTMPLLDFSGNEIRTKQCDKQHFSDIDGVNDILNGARNGVVRPRTVAYASAQTHITGGLRLGMEICRDHFLKVLRTWRDSSNSKQVAGAPLAPLALHLLVTCGMDLIDGHCAADSDGLVFRCNGNRFNYTAPEATREDKTDRSIRSDVYGKGQRPHWRRILNGMRGEWDLPHNLQRPWRNQASVQDGYGVSPAYLVRDEHRL